jgi:thiol-disulfide isomerase/thioredoxin
MHILSIHNKSELFKGKGKGKNKNVVDDMIKNNKHVFIIIYMEGCGPCNATRPEWSKMAHTLQKQYANNKEIAIIDLNKDLLPLVKNVGDVSGFPTMKYITDKGHTIESYEDSAVKNKDRSVDSFINWVESKVLKGKIVSTNMPGPEHVYKRLSKKERTRKNFSKKHKGKNQRQKGKPNKGKKTRKI